MEDNDVFREALELLLGLRTDMKVVASVSDGTAPRRRRQSSGPTWC